VSEKEETTITMWWRIGGPEIGDIVYVYTSTSAVSGKIVEIRHEGNLLTLVIEDGCE
jgi:hypothetical protein